MTIGLIITLAIGGTLALEGAVWAIFPSQMRRAYAESLRLLDDKALHIGGLCCVAIGVGLIMMAVKFGT